VPGTRHGPGDRRRQPGLLRGDRTQPAELLGQYLFDTFPDNPAYPEADGVETLKASLHRVLASGHTDHMMLQKYDIPVPGNPDAFLSPG
jgi:hypothetical protein